MLGQIAGHSGGERPGHLLEVVPSTMILLSASSHRVMSAAPRDSRTETSHSLRTRSLPADTRLQRVRSIPKLPEFTAQQTGVFFVMFNVIVTVKRLA